MNPELEGKKWKSVTKKPHVRNYLKFWLLKPVVSFYCDVSLNLIPYMEGEAPSVPFFRFMLLKGTLCLTTLRTLKSQIERFLDTSKPLKLKKWFSDYSRQNGWERILKNRRFAWIGFYAETKKWYSLRKILIKHYSIDVPYKG